MKASVQACGLTAKHVAANDAHVTLRINLIVQHGRHGRSHHGRAVARVAHHAARHRHDAPGIVTSRGK